MRPAGMMDLGYKKTWYEVGDGFMEWDLSTIRGKLTEDVKLIAGQLSDRLTALVANPRRYTDQVIATDKYVKQWSGLLSEAGVGGTIWVVERQISQAGNGSVANGEQRSRGFRVGVS